MATSQQAFDAKRDRARRQDASRAREQELKQQLHQQQERRWRESSVEAELVETGAGVATTLTAAPSVPSLTESKVDAVLAAGAAHLKSLAPGASEWEEEEDPNVPLTEKQRAKKLGKISSRIADLLGEFEDSVDDEDDGTMQRLKEGITTIAQNLRRKSLMRSAFLQSAAQQLSKSKQLDPSLFGGADDEDDEGRGDAKGAGASLAEDEAGLAVDELKRTEGLKKAILLSAHKKTVGLLRDLAAEHERGKTGADEQRAAMAAKFEGAAAEELRLKTLLEVATTSERNLKTQLASASERLARLTAEAESLQRSADELAARLAAAEQEAASERSKAADAAAALDAATRGSGAMRAQLADALAQLDDARSSAAEAEAAAAAAPAAAAAAREALDSARAEVEAAEAAAAAARDEAEAARAELAAAQDEAVAAAAEAAAAAAAGAEAAAAAALAQAEAAAASTERKTKNAMTGMQSALWRATQARLPQQVQEAIAAEKAQWEAARAAERAEWEAKLEAAMANAGADAAAQAEAARAAAAAAEQLKAMQAMAAEQLEAMQAMAAGFEAKLAEAKLAQARASAGAGLPEQLAAQLAARVQEIEAERPAPGALCALVQAASEVLSPRMGAVWSEVLQTAQQRQLIELTAATSEGKDSKVLDDAVTVAWNHLWAFSLSHRPRDTLHACAHYGAHRPPSPQVGTLALTGRGARARPRCDAGRARGRTGARGAACGSRGGARPTQIGEGAGRGGGRLLRLPSLAA